MYKKLLQIACVFVFLGVAFSFGLSSITQTTQAQPSISWETSDEGIDEIIDDLLEGLEMVELEMRLQELIEKLQEGETEAPSPISEGEIESLEERLDALVEMLEEDVSSEDEEIESLKERLDEIIKEIDSIGVVMDEMDDLERVVIELERMLELEKIIKELEDLLRLIETDEMPNVDVVVNGVHYSDGDWVTVTKGYPVKIEWEAENAVNCDVSGYTNMHNIGSSGEMNLSKEQVDSLPDKFDAAITCRGVATGTSITEYFRVRIVEQRKTHFQCFIDELRANLESKLRDDCQEIRQKMNCAGVTSYMATDTCQGDYLFERGWTPEDYIRVTRPEMRDEWILQRPLPVEWDYSGVAGDVDIYLCFHFDTGSPFMTKPSLSSLEMEIGVQSPHSYVPERRCALLGRVPASQQIFRVPFNANYPVIYDAATVYVVDNENPRNFGAVIVSVRGEDEDPGDTGRIRVDSPRGGSVWREGERMPILWRTEGVHSSLRANIYLQQDGYSQKTIATNVPIEQEEYSWRVDLGGIWEATLPHSEGVDAGGDVDDDGLLIGLREKESYRIMIRLQDSDEHDDIAVGYSGFFEIEDKDKTPETIAVPGHDFRVTVRDVGSGRWAVAKETCEGFGSSWSLPTPEQAEALYDYRTELGGFVRTFYWTDEEGRYLNFSNGVFGNTDPGAHIRYRCVVEDDDIQEVYCESDDDCEWVSVNCCPEHSGAQWECRGADKLVFCPEDVICMTVVNPKPTTPCVCSDGDCVEGEEQVLERSFGGMFALNVEGGCRYENLLTESCTCPSGFMARPTTSFYDGARRIYPERGIRKFQCVPVENRDLLDSSNNIFGGIYTDNLDGSCRRTNPFTGDCSCPDGFKTLWSHEFANPGCKWRFYADSRRDADCGIIEQYCISENYQSLIGQDIFMGIHTANKDGSCRYRNPFTGNCSCPEGAIEVPIYDFVSPGCDFYGDGGKRDVCGVYQYYCVQTKTRPLPPPPPPVVQECPNVGVITFEDPTEGRDTSFWWQRVGAINSYEAEYQINGGAWQKIERPGAATSKGHIFRFISHEKLGSAGNTIRVRVRAVCGGEDQYLTGNWRYSHTRTVRAAVGLESFFREVFALNTANTEESGLLENTLGVLRRSLLATLNPFGMSFFD